MGAHANDWYSDWTLTEPEANRQVHELDVRFDFYAERKPSDVRPLPVPQPVVLYGWQPAGDLDVWVRDEGKWWGRVRDNETGLYRWYPAAQLQPCHQRPTTADPAAPLMKRGDQGPRRGRAFGVARDLWRQGKRVRVRWPSSVWPVPAGSMSEQHTDLLYGRTSR